MICPQMAMICGQTGEFGPIFHNFIDFVAVLLLLATMICVLWPAGESHSRLFLVKQLALSSALPKQHALAHGVLYNKPRCRLSPLIDRNVDFHK